MILNANESYGRCPMCGHSVRKGSKGWYCLNYKNGCPFVLYYNMKRFDDIIVLTDESVKKLLSKKSVKVTLKSKSGRKYGAYVTLQIKGKYINLKVKELIKLI